MTARLLPLLLLTACGGPWDLEAACDRDDITCGTVEVPARHDLPDDGRTYTLTYLVQHASGEAPADDPLILFNGGPATSTLALQALADTRLGRDLVARRDLVFVDVRGIAESEPDLSCPELEDVYAPLYDQAIGLGELEALKLEALLDCRDRLAEDDIDLNDFTALQLAHDAAAVLTELGYERWNAWGVSYGTIIAQHLARHYPEQTRSLVLDSAPGLDTSALEYAPLNGSLAVQVHFDQCAADEGCARAFPDYEADFDQLVEDTQQSPLDIASTDPYTGEDITYPLDGDMLLLQFAGALASVPFQKRAPGIVYDLIDGRTGILDGDPRSTMIYDPASVDLWTTTTRCSEQVDFELEAALADERIRPALGRALGPLLEQAQLACDPLGIELLPPEERAPLESDVPALVMNGEVDITTAPWMAEHIGETLPNAHVYTVPTMGHVTISVCTWDMMAAFLDDPERAPDASCLDALEPAFKTGCGCATTAGPAGATGALALVALLVARRRR